MIADAEGRWRRVARLVRVRRAIPAATKKLDCPRDEYFSGYGPGKVSASAAGVSLGGDAMRSVLFGFRMIATIVAADVSTSAPIIGALLRLRVTGGAVDHADGAFSSDPRRITFQVNNAMTAGALVQIQLEVPNPSVDVTVENVRLRVESIKR